MSLFCPFSGAAQAGMSVSAQGGAKQKRVPFSRPGLAGTMAMTTGGRMLPACGGLLDARLADRPPRGGRTYAQLRQGPAFRRLRCPAQQPCPVRYTEDPDPEIPKKKTKGWGNVSKTRMGKRVASLLLSLVMMLSLLPTTVYAEGADTGDTTDEIVGQATTSGDNTEGTGEPEPTGEGEDGSANVTEGADGAATNDAVVEETIAPVNAEGVDAVANAESGGDEVSGGDGSEAGNKAETYVAQVGDTKYATLKEAIAAANAGDTVTLLAHVNLMTSTQAISKQLTIDLNGKTISSTAYRTIQINADADLTVKDTASGGKITNAYIGSSYPSAIYLKGTGAKFTLESGTIESDPNVTSLQSVAINSEKDMACTVNINGGSVVVPEAATDGRAIVASTNSMTLNISGGTITGGLHGVDAYSGSNVTITGGKITARVVDTGVIKEAYGMRLKGTANVTVAGGEITGVKMDDNGYKGDVPTVKLKSGNIKGSFYSISKGTIIFDVAENADIVLENNSAEQFLPDTVELVQNADDTYGVKKTTYVAEVNGTQYETLQEAIKAASTGNTITLLDDVDLGSSKIGFYKTGCENLTFDLNGHKITSAIQNNGTVGASRVGLVIKNGTIENTCMDTNAKKATSAVYVTSGGTTTLENVTLHSNYSGLHVCQLSNAVTVVVNVEKDTVINGGMYGVNLDAPKGTATTAPGVTLNVNGGTITGTEYGIHANSPSSGKYGTINANITAGTVGGVRVVSNNTKQPVKLDITGGTINGELYNLGSTITISGGTFENPVDPSYCAEGYTPVKNADGTYGVVEAATAVAQIGETTYATLEAAIAAAESGATITLLDDLDLSTTGLTIAANKDVILDLNGKTLKLANTESGNIKVFGKLTLQDSTDTDKNGTGTGKVWTETSYILGKQDKVLIAAIDGGTFIMESGLIDAASFTTDNDNDGQFAVSVQNENADATVIINGGCIKAGWYAIAGNGQNIEYNGNITVNGGILESTADYAIYHPHSGTTTINGGVVFGAAGGVSLNRGKLIVNNGIITSKGTGTTGDWGDGTGNQNAAAINVHAGYGSTSVEIKGGKITAEKDAILLTNGKDGTIKVSGGTFNSAVKEEYCAAGYIPVANDGGTYGVKEGSYVAETNGVKYETLQAAIDAAKRNETVTLLANTRENVTIDKALTLDLNGFTLNGSTGERKPALTVTASVTVKDSSTAQTGTIMRDDTAENSGVSSHYVIDIQGNSQGRGWLTFEGGNVKNDSGAGGTKGASLVRVGSDSVAKYPGLNIKGGTFTQDNFIVIKVERGDLFLNGGSLNSANSYAVQTWHRATIKGGTVNGNVSSWTYDGGPGAETTISGGTVNGNVEAISYDDKAGKPALVSISGGTVNGTLIAGIYNSATEPTKDMATIKITGGTFSNDPTKYVVEDSAITQNADGTFGVAKAYLAKVGETSYYTMDEAFKAQTASGKPIVLLRDYTTGSTFNSGTVARVVDLDRHTWTCTGTDANSAAFEINNPNATLTVKNGKIVSSQLVGLIPSAMGGTIKYDNSSLTFENVEMSTTATSGIETNGNNANDTVTLKNSTLNVPNGFGIYFPSSGTLTIDNSTITAKTMGVQVCAGSLSINAGSAITVTGDAVPKTENDGAIQDGAAISIVNRTGYNGLGNVTVTGGTFTAKADNKAIKAYNWANNTETEFTANDKVFVSGGTFSSAVPEGLCATGYISVANNDGTHTVKKGVYVAKVDNVKYETLQAAIDAAKSGDTVTLLKDIDLPATAVVKGKTITLDLNGRTISNSADIWDESKYAWSLISVRDNGDLTINDTAGGGTLKAKENDCFALDVYAYDTKNVEDTKLTINAGNYVGNISAVYAFTGKATINGGHFSIQQKESGSDPYRLTLNCYDSSYTAGRAGFTVNGGTFENFDPRNNPAEGAGTSFVAESVGVDKNTDGTFTAKPNMAAQIVDAGGGSVAAYADHWDAIAAAKDGETVILLSDRKNFVTNTINANITIDLNGKTLSVGNNNPFFRTNGEVTIQNGTIESNYACVIVNAYNKLTLKNVKITGVTGDSGKNLVNVCSNAEVTIDKDTVLTASGSNGAAVFIGQDADAKYTLNVYGKVIRESKSFAISGNGSYKGTTTINIYDGAEVKSASVAIYHPQAGVINVNGGLVEGYCAIGIKSGSLNIKGGTVRGTANDHILDDSDSISGTIRYDGSAIVVDSHTGTGYKGDVNIKISGSAFIQSRCSTGIREIGNDAGKTNVKGLSISGGTVLSGGGKDAVQVREVTKNNVFITGGSFSTDVAAYCATGYQCNVPTADEPLYTVTKKDADEIDVKRSLTLDNSLTMNYKVKLPTGYTSARVEFKFYNDYTKAFETVTVTGVFNNSTGRYESAFTGINPQRMTDTLKATVYATNEDTQEETAFPVDDFSAAQYCNVLLASGYNKNGAYNELVGNLVAYGTAAQLYQKYHTDKLVSSVVTGGTVVQHPLADVAEVNELTAVTGGVSIEKKSLVLSNAFAIRVKFALEGDTTIDQVTFKVKADAKTATISQFEKETLSDGTVYYYFDFAGLNSKQLGSTVTFTAVVDGKDNDVLAFSANTYLKLMSNVAGVSTELKNLLAALYNYGYTCRNFKA